MEPVPEKIMPNAKTEFPVEQIRLVAVSLAFISYGVLSFEVILTRIFSVMLTYNYVFAVISFALLGLGLGGMSRRKWRSWFPRSGYARNAGWFAFTMAASVWIIIKIPIYDNMALVNLRVWIYILITTVPFFFAGLTMAELFRVYAARSSFLYGMDLTGATAAALTVVLLLNTFNAVEAALVSAVISAAGALLLGISARKTSYLSIATVILVLAATFFSSAGIVNQTVPIALDPSKDLIRFMNNPRDTIKVVESRWSAFGRTDLIQSKLSPEEMIVFVDGAAGTSMYDLTALLADEKKQARMLHSSGEFFPFYFLDESEKDSALIIGPGGGKDVVIALIGGVKSITAVEVNPDIVKLVKDYENFNGGIYSRMPNVQVVVQEGRNYLRASRQKYDLIMLALPITKSSRSLEGYALTENYLFTVEAFEDYLKHLTPEGRIVIVGHSGMEIYRLLVLALRAFNKQNIDESSAMKHIYTLGTESRPAIVIKKQPFDSLSAQKRHTYIHELGYDRAGFFLPFVPQQTLQPMKDLGIDTEWAMLDKILVDISEGKLNLGRLQQLSPFGLRPVTDDSPFFYNPGPGLPKPFGTFSILIIFIVVLLMYPLLFVRKSKIPSSNILKPFFIFPRLKIFLLLFFLLGVGFMMLEIALLQKLTLFIGRPVLALTVLLFSILLGAGLGSMLSAKIKRRLALMMALVALMVVLLAIGYGLKLNALFSLNVNSRLMAVLLLTPLGFFMGFPFPLSIRLMKMNNLQEYVDWMWGVNGVASVVGSALTMIIGILWGFSYALFLGSFVYACVGLLGFILLRLKRKEGYAPVSGEKEEVISV